MLSLAGAGVVTAVIITSPVQVHATTGRDVADAVPEFGAAYVLTAQHTFGWVSQYFGPGASLTRYDYLGLGGPVEVDVLRNAENSAIGSAQSSIYYAGGGAIAVGKTTLTGGLTAEIQASNPAGEINATDNAWTSVSWVLRHGSESDQVTVFVAQDETVLGPAAPQIVRPSIRTSLIRPFGLLIRGRASLSDSRKPATGQLVSLANQLLAAERIAG
jgi:hypothetical protein